MSGVVREFRNTVVVIWRWTKEQKKVLCPELGGWGLAGFCRGELNVAIFFAHINWLLYSRTSKKCVSYTLGYCYYFGAATIGNVGTFPGSHLGARANAKVGEATTVHEFHSRSSIRFWGLRRAKRCVMLYDVMFIFWINSFANRLTNTLKKICYVDRIPDVCDLINLPNYFQSRSFLLLSSP